MATIKRNSGGLDLEWVYRSKQCTPQVPVVLSTIIIDNAEVKRRRVSKPRRVGKACVERSKEPIREGAARNLENALHHLLDLRPDAANNQISSLNQCTTKEISKEDHSLFAVTALSFGGLQYVHCTASCYGPRPTEAPGKIKQEVVIANESTYSLNKFLDFAVYTNQLASFCYPCPILQSAWWAVERDKMLHSAPARLCKGAVFI